MIDDPLALGATLYMPATRDDLVLQARGERIAGLRSMVVCLEDAIAPGDVGAAFARVEALLTALARDPRPLHAPALFLRPRDPAMLARLLDLPAIAAVDGFVLPKVTVESWPAWRDLRYRPHHRLMPTLETREACDPIAMQGLRETLLASRHRILVLRIGGNDLLQLCGARRSRVRTAYDGPLGAVIAGLVAAFAPWGLPLAAPVFEHHRNPDLLAAEVERDIEHGLCTKTAIHPAQIPVIQSAYRVSASELFEARAVLAERAPGSFGGGHGMLEPATHARWARQILRRAELFGTHGAERAALSA